MPRDAHTRFNSFRNRINREVSGTFIVLARRMTANKMEEVMGLGRGALLWLLGVPLPIIIVLALFWHH